MSEVSRLASGSSCRSFFAPWCIWDKSGARKIHLEIGRLLHDVIIINVDAKEVSSSEAHRRVTSSLLFEGREKRAAIRCEKLIESLNNGRWDSAQQICWEEDLDMHALFATADPHFEYIHTETMRILSIMQNCWKEHGDGPLVTIDAGPNVHLLWRNDQNLLRNETKQKIICCALAAKDV
jgi:diphosphomevalonate decarboxylase